MSLQAVKAPSSKFGVADRTGTPGPSITRYRCANAADANARKSIDALNKTARRRSKDIMGSVIRPRSGANAGSRGGAADAEWNSLTILSLPVSDSEADLSLIWLRPIALSSSFPKWSVRRFRITASSKNLARAAWALSTRPKT